MVAQAQSNAPPTLAKVKEWLAIGGVIVVVGGGLIGGMKLVIAPLQTDIRAIHGRLDRMDAPLDRLDDRLDSLGARLDRMDARFERVEQGIAELGARLTRVETLLEKDAPQ